MKLTCPTCHQHYRGTQTSGGHHMICHQSFRSQKAFDAHLTNHEQGTCLDVTTSPDWMRHPKTGEWTLTKTWEAGQEYWA